MVRSSLHLLVGSLALAGSLLCNDPALAQQTTVNSPISRTSHGYSENIGVQWGFRFPGGFFQFGGPPPAGAANGARGGTSWGSGDTGGYFNFYAGQSSNTGFSGGSSSVTVGNGQTGGIFEGRQVPFVLGVVPVVGDFAAGSSGVGVPYAPGSAFQDRVARLRAEGVDLTAPPSDKRTSETATVDAPPAANPVPPGVIGPPTASVEALAQAKAAADLAEQANAAREIDNLLAKADDAITAEKPGLAKVYLQMALRRASGEQKTEIIERLRAISDR